MGLTHKHTPCAKEAIEAYSMHLPRNLNENRKFQREMYSMQMDLINCHYEDMAAEDKHRAARTMQHIEEIIGKL